MVDLRNFGFGKCAELDPATSAFPVWIADELKVNEAFTTLQTIFDIFELTIKQSRKPDEKRSEEA
jgi:hypothetical protein